MNPHVQPSDLLPANIEAEQALLGAILLNNEAFGQVSGIVCSDDFSEAVHQKVFDVVSELIGKGRVVNPVTLRGVLPYEMSIGGISLGAYLARLASEATSVIGAADYARTVKDMSRRRAMIDIADSLKFAALSGESSVNPIPHINDAIGSLDKILSDASSRSKLKALSAKEAAAEAVDMAARAYQLDGRITGITYGLRDIDQMTSGMHPAEVVILAGRPGMGKTAAALCVARAAANSGEGVLIFSLEMSASALGMRLLSESASVPYHSIRAGKITERDFEVIARSAEQVGDLPIIIEQEPSLSLGQISARARKARDAFAKDGIALGVIIVDYLQLVKPNERYAGQRVNEVAEISSGLKAVCKEMNCAMLALSQLSRQVESRDDKRPQLSDLRDSGSIEQDADTVIFLYREEYYLTNREPEPFTEKHAEWQSAMRDCQNKVDWIVSKQRHGPTGTRTVYLNVATNTMRDLAREVA